ncbi:hypothetical protein RHA1_ro00427 [Rhodococcus jostii RHA1]|uniref:Uncharacterized protein n=1 Tax=Rhodococcus jostii (strain RHA1) TaxID=101510 RepID=Q0SJM3_RHOJR|nr:hypothetical protein RHA1_ro00427 [Rhodococcus jostii RHA1]
MAIVGSGPSGCYAAESSRRGGLPRRDARYSVGLIRFGVAPDSSGDQDGTPISPFMRWKRCWRARSRVPPGYVAREASASSPPRGRHAGSIEAMTATIVEEFSTTSAPPGERRNALR